MKLISDLRTAQVKISGRIFWQNKPRNADQNTRGASRQGHRGRFVEDSRLFKKLYGQDHDQGTPHGLRLIYELWAMLAKLTAKGNDKSEDAELRKEMAALVDAEIECGRD
jgi:hypothetical protein